MADVIIIMVLAVILGTAVRYIYKEKKKGKCVGCPSAGCCPHSCNGHNKD